MGGDSNLEQRFGAVHSVMCLQVASDTCTCVYVQQLHTSLPMCACIVAAGAHCGLTTCMFNWIKHDLQCNFFTSYNWLAISLLQVAVEATCTHI